MPGFGGARLLPGSPGHRKQGCLLTPRDAGKIPLQPRWLGVKLRQSFTESPVPGVGCQCDPAGAAEPERCRDTVT